VYDTVT